MKVKNNVYVIDYQTIGGLTKIRLDSKFTTIQQITE